jgi:uncharacterized Zn-binding protein involved in type VI secretion
MGKPIAKQGDRIVGVDIHNVMNAESGVTAPLELPFEGTLMLELSPNVLVNGLYAATVGSIAENVPPHEAQVVPNSLTVITPETNQGKVATGSETVKINGKSAARLGDFAETCHDIPPPVPTPPGTPPAQEPTPTIVVMGPNNVFAGD